jgi:hypothetical protein
MTFKLKKLLAVLPGGVLAALSSIEIEKDVAEELVLNADGWPVVFNKSTQLISESGRPITSFSSVDSISIAHFVNSRRFEWWTLNLNLRNGRRIKIGRSVDDAKVSIAAAHVASITGKIVRTQEGVGL